MFTLSPPAPATGGIFDRLDAEWAVLCADTSVQAAVTDWLMTDRLADDVAAVTDSWVRSLGPAQLLATLRPGSGVLSDALTDAVLRALLQRAAGRDRSATLAARIIVQAMIPAAVRMTSARVRSYGDRTFETVGHMSVAALFEVARSGRIHDRPGRPAAGLALGALKLLCRDLAFEREREGEDLAVAEDLADTAPGPAACAHDDWIRTAAVAAGLAAADAASEAETSSARLELLELVLDAMESGTLSPGDGRAIAWYYTAAPVPDTKAARLTGSTINAWQRRRSRAVDRLKSTAPCAA